jgi:SagB-type dehydrogenase family enzyme
MPEVVSLEELRPLAQVLPREEDGCLVFQVGDREVSVEGDLAFVRAVIERCDGLHGLQELSDAVNGTLADVRELIGTLAEHDVVVDCTEAWRRFHRETGVQSGLYRPIGDAALAELRTWSFRPGAPTSRSQPLAPVPSQVTNLASRRRSAFATEQPRPVSFEELSTLLEAMYGARGRRPVPSGGALYPIVVHVGIFDPVGPLDPGLWWYDPAAASLEHVHERASEVRSLFIPLPSTEPILDRAHPVIFLSADLRRSARKYASRAYRLALMEIGALMQNAYLVGAETGLPLRAVAGFDDRAAEQVLELPDGAAALLTLLLGS